MSGKPVVLRERARRDIDEVIEHYLSGAGAETGGCAGLCRRAGRRTPADWRTAGRAALPAMRMSWIFPACAFNRSEGFRIRSSMWRGKRTSTSGASCMGRETSRSSPHFSPRSRPASHPGVRSARSGSKSVSGNTVEARDAAGGRLGATRRAALSGRQRASRRLPDAPRRAGRARKRTMRCAPFLLCRPDSAAQTMNLVRSVG